MTRKFDRDSWAPFAAFAAFAFLLHFAWEILQAPFFARMATLPHWEAILTCFKATLGDVALALTSFGAGALLDRRYQWFLKPSAPATIAYVATGLIATFFLERQALSSGRWSYSELMPVVPVMGIGLVPLLQWTVLPILNLLLTQRLFRVPESSNR